MILLELFVLAFVVLVLVWGAYAMLRTIIEGRRGTPMLVVLAAVGLVFMLIVGQGSWLVGLDAFACSDQAEIVMEAAPGPSARLGTIEGWDLLNCTIYWRDRPRVWG
jgi:ABC-type amino acid transport system permease subunit